MENGKNIISVIGINHRTATIEDRELLEIDRKSIKEVLTFIYNNKAVEGVLILNTCNRLEFYMYNDGNVAPFDIIKDYYSANRGLDISDKAELFYTYTGQEAIRHLFRVISGLDSLVLGEYQIQGQVRDAYSLACNAKTMENVLHKLFHAAFRCGKTVRNKTSIGTGKQSVSGVAAGLFLEQTKPDEKIAIIGVNENTRIIASTLCTAGFKKLVFVNRTYYKAEMMADEFGGEAYPLDKIMYVLTNADAVYSCTGAEGYIVNSLMLHSLAKRNIGPKLIVDMAVPRDFNTEGLPEHIKTYDISDLNEYLARQSEQHEKDLPLAEKIIENEVKVFSAWTDYQGSDLLKPYAEKFEMTRLQLLEEYRTQFPEQTYRQVDRLTRQMLHRLQASFINVLKKNNQK